MQNEPWSISGLSMRENSIPDHSHRSGCLHAPKDDRVFPGSKAEELLEVVCHEDNDDLEHLKDVKTEYRAQQKKGDSAR